MKILIDKNFSIDQEVESKKKFANVFIELKNIIEIENLFAWRLFIL